MEIVAIEGRAFEQMKRRFEDFTRQVKQLCEDGRNNEKWLENSEVCGLLQISQRTLQSYRDNGILSYSQIGRKCYYKTSDVEQLLNPSKQESR
ncbi:DNA-binding protein [Betaproteobacteria bacterium]|nr:DNA-binding protein [Betaproteobacteria bacterium]